MTKQLKETLINSSLILVSLLIPIIVFEIVIIMKAQDYQGLKKGSQIYNVVRHNYVRHGVKVIQMSDECARYDDGLFYTLRPGNCDFSNLEFDTHYDINSEGLRDDELSLKAPEVIALGDSYTMGWGVEQSESFIDIIEQETNKNALNAGISSYGTARESILFERLDTSNLKYLIWQYSENDIDENRAFVGNNFNLEISSRDRYEEVKEKSQKGYSPLMHFGRFVKQITQNVSTHSLARKTSEEEVEYFLKIINNLNFPEEVKIIVFELSDAAFLNNGFADVVERVIARDEFSAIRDKVIIIDVAEILDENDDYFKIDTHINRSGHQKLADYLINIIE